MVGPRISVPKVPLGDLLATISPPTGCPAGSPIGRSAAASAKHGLD